jgi:hypothetical protein
MPEVQPVRPLSTLPGAPATGWAAEPVDESVPV